MQWPGWLVATGDFLAPFAVWKGYEMALQSLVIYGVGIAFYTVLVFAFYQNLSKRDAFAIQRKKGFVGRTIHGFQAGFVFPLMSFLYFGVLGTALFLLAKSQTTFEILLLAMAVVVGVRVTAFVSENAALDLAKMLPLALLGVLIVDPSYTSLEVAWARVLETPTLLPVLWRFFALFIVLEGALRIGRLIVVKLHVHVPKRKAAKRAKGVPKAELIADVGKAPAPKMVDMAAER